MSIFQTPGQWPIRWDVVGGCNLFACLSRFQRSASIAGIGYQTSNIKQTNSLTKQKGSTPLFGTACNKPSCAPISSTCASIFYTCASIFPTCASSPFFTFPTCLASSSSSNPRRRPLSLTIAVASLQPDRGTKCSLPHPQLSPCNP